MAKATKATKKTFLELYKNNMGNVTKTCRMINIHKSSYYRWLDKYPKFKRDIEEIKEEYNEELIILAKQGLITNLKKCKQSAIEYTLNNKTNGEYSNTVKKELTGKDGEPINVNFIIKMGDK